MKQTVEEAAYDYATNKTKFRKDVLKEVDADTYVSRHADSMDDFQCGAVYFAPGWVDSKGCNLEYAAAKIYGKTIYT